MRYNLPITHHPPSILPGERVVILACLACLQGWGHPAVAHNIQTDGRVGATFHIEPDHNPRAGEPTTAWFALTRSGGETIPLAQCDCQLAVYDPTQPETPVLTPPLNAIAIEQDRDVPGAEIVFPQAGIYELEISGSPKTGADFPPFSLAYSVTVSPGKPAETQPVSVPATPPTPTTDDRPRYGVAIGLGGVIAAISFWFTHRQASK
jgi:hypothetical protein